MEGPVRGDAVQVQSLFQQSPSNKKVPGDSNSTNTEVAAICSQAGSHSILFGINLLDTLISEAASFST